MNLRSTRKPSGKAAAGSQKPEDDSDSITLEPCTPTKRTARKSTFKKSQKLKKIKISHSPHQSVDNADNDENVESEEIDPIPNSLSKLMTPKGSKTPCIGTPASRTPKSVFQESKSLFRKSCTPARLIGRENERTIIQTFIKYCLDNGGSSLYVCGTPGTGKSALISEILRSFKVQDVFINCMNVSSARLIYRDLCKALGLWKSETTEDCIELLEKLFMPAAKSSKVKSKLILVVLDEIDHLLTNSPDVLYKIFEWAKLPNSKLVLIGIANALDLTKRFLPRLEAKNVGPQLLVFQPYKVDEMTNIIKARLMSLYAVDENSNINDNSPLKSHTKNTLLLDALTNSPLKRKTVYLDQNELDSPKEKANKLPLMHPMAVEFAARKIAASGDLRKALDVCRHAIEIFESECTPDDITELESLDDLPQVGIKHVLAATKAMLGTSSSQRIAGMQMQAKLVLVTLVLLNRKKIATTMAKVREGYTALCNYKHQVFPVQSTELNDLIIVLEGHGLISVTTKRQVKHVDLTLSNEEVEQGVNASPMLTEVLQNGLKALEKIK